MAIFPWKTGLCGALTGIVNVLFGAGGGMILVPLLRKSTDLEDAEVFPASISIMLPICIVSLTVYGFRQPLPWVASLPYLLGSALGGIGAGLWGKRVPVKWLHRILGLLILWGGIRYIW